MSGVAALCASRGDVQHESSVGFGSSGERPAYPMNSSDALFVLSLIEVFGDRCVEDIRLLDIGDVPGVLDLKKT